LLQFFHLQLKRLIWLGIDLQKIKIQYFFLLFAKEYPKKWFNQEILKNWEKIFFLREQVLKEIEKKRESGVVGSSLEAEVFINCKGEDYSFYKKYQNIFNEIFIVSSVSIKEGDFVINIEKAKGKNVYVVGIGAIVLVKTQNTLIFVISVQKP